LRLLIQGGRVVDPSQGLDEKLDILVEGGCIVRLAAGINPPARAKLIPAQGKLVVPGLIDMHTHLREPGREDEETITSGAKAAVNGGITSVACMANTQPVNDNQAVTDFIYSQAKRAGCCNVYPVGGITQGLQGKQLAEMGELMMAGVVAFSDDGHSVMNSEVMRRAMEYAAMLGLPLICHCQDTSLASEGVMHEGLVSTVLGLKGVPAEAEEIMVARDIALAALTGARIHIAHVSTAGSVELIRQAKSRGIMVSAEATPHHFSLTHEAVRSFDTHTKVNPPLRTKEDVAAIIDGLADGTIDVIASDHAPHTSAEKELEYTYAPFGMIGLETLLPLSLSKLVHSGAMELTAAIAKLTINPARILGLDKGTLRVGAKADITIIELDKRIKLDVTCFKSKSRNSPFHHWELQGVPWMTIVGGKFYPAGEIGHDL
jgi:dihydroorotase